MSRFTITFLSTLILSTASSTAIGSTSNDSSFEQPSCYNSQIPLNSLIQQFSNDSPPTGSSRTIGARYLYRTYRTKFYR